MPSGHTPGDLQQVDVVERREGLATLGAAGDRVAEWVGGGEAAEGLGWRATIWGDTRGREGGSNRREGAHRLDLGREVAPALAVLLARAGDDQHEASGAPDRSSCIVRITLISGVADPRITEAWKGGASGDVSGKAHSGGRGGGARAGREARGALLGTSALQRRDFGSRQSRSAGEPRRACSSSTPSSGTSWRDDRHTCCVYRAAAVESRPTCRSCTSGRRRPRWREVEAPSETGGDARQPHQRWSIGVDEISRRSSPSWPASFVSFSSNSAKRVQRAKPSAAVRREPVRTAGGERAAHTAGDSYYDEHPLAVGD